MTTPVDVVQRFNAQTEEEKIACHQTSSEGPYFLFEEYEITLEEVATE